MKIEGRIGEGKKKDKKKKQGLQSPTYIQWLRNIKEYRRYER